MIHLGDITKIHGDQIEPVDCITFGSPCQDLSIAGRRAGLAGERSGLFMEAVRIIKEMRLATDGMYPTFAVWENVPGAFSSNGGEDFRAVLEELARVEQPAASIPRPPRGGRWSKAGTVCGNGWSLAWRQLDAQYWGVAQRRKRIALVADFRGRRAGTVLFERTGLSGNLDKSIPPWETFAGTAQNGTAGYDRVVGAGGFRNGGQSVAGNGAGTTETRETGSGAGTESADRGTRIEETAQTFAVDCRNGRMEAEISGTLQAKENGGYSLNYKNPVAYSLKIRSGCAGGGKGALVQTEKVGTLSTLQDQTLFQAVPVLNDQGGSMMGVTYNVTGTLRAAEHGHQPIVFDARGNGDGKIVPTITGDHESRITDYTAITLENKTVAGALMARDYKGAGRNDFLGRLVAQNVIVRWIVRRLTPTECERLQGYPDGWTDIGEWVDTKGKKHKPADTPRYKALGNSIALPQWFWIAQKMKPYLESGAKLGSLFDGIGGFPLVWETTYGKGTARWASEIEEFPIAVTKKWFPEKEDGT